MSVSVSFNGTTYTIPATGDTGWGAQVTAFIQAVGSASLQKTGGSFTLTAEADFGGTYGLKSTYFKSRTTGAASAGALRLARADLVEWRNQAGDGNLTLGVDSSNNLEWGAVDVALASNAAPAVLYFGAVSTGNDTTARYLYPGGPTTAANTAVQRLLVPYAGTVSKLYVGAGTGPGSDCTFTVTKGGSGQTVTAVMASAAFTASDTTHSFTVAAGDTLGIKLQLASNTGAPADIFASIQLTKA